MPRIEILRCASCGAPIAIPEEGDASCAHCGASSEVPEPLRALRRLERDHDEAERRGEALLEELDRSASLPIRLLAAITDLPGWAFVLVYGLPLGITAILLPYFELPRILPLFGHESLEELQFGGTLMACTAVLLVFTATFLPRALGVYAARRATARERLLQRLRAQPPQTEGGLSRCRACGASLDVPRGAKLARCPFCLSDNVLVLSRVHVRGAAQTLSSLLRTMGDASAVDRAERAATRRRLGSELLRYLGGTLIVGGGFVIAMWDSERTAGGSDLGIAATFVSALSLLGLVTWSFLGRDLGRKNAADDERSYTGALAAVRILVPMLLYGGCCLWGILTTR